jgi:hypothetical protein
VRPTIASALALATIALLACHRPSRGGTGASGGASATAAPAAHKAAPAPVGPGHTHTCKNPPATGKKSLACIGCYEQQCGSSWSGVLDACGAFFSCIEACDCTDEVIGPHNCGACWKLFDDPTCLAATTPWVTCEKAHCETSGVCVEAKAP